MRKRLFLVILVIAVLLDLFTGCPSPVNSTRESVTRERLLEMVNNNMDVTQVDTSHITDMSELFNNNKSFNQDISGWNVSNVADMRSMFQGASSFNGDISGWNVSKVISMSSMFQGASSFNGDISGWNVSSVVAMGVCFKQHPALMVIYPAGM